ncbi:apolipoprotein D-like [Mizuhopecten yessoensis]|uniref:Apolipoprotein D n=1 Tax=Mizuhopecten yessoensis TaxID=6573 RepID=A0A210QPG8_MIZYE|nr:apolipoprotein D-like [Mizuhopecten yessoensis]OWF50627.1 Apolipoprotein D [Mizuhopecten yessoensis]
MASSLVFLVVVAIGVTSGQRISWGKCPDVPLKRNFQMSKYTGIWYEHESYPAPWYSSSVSCGHSSFTITDDGSMQVTSGGVDGSGHPYTMTGSANIPDKKYPARLQLRYSRWSTDDYQVIASNYRSFSLVYACSDYAFFRSEKVWLLTRQRGEINAKSVKRVYKILRTYGIDSEPLTPMDNGQC